MIGWGDALCLPVTLYVEPYNPARRLYERLGFGPIELLGIYQRMERPATADAAPDAARRVGDGTP